MWFWSCFLPSKGCQAPSRRRAYRGCLRSERSDSPCHLLPRHCATWGMCQANTFVERILYSAPPRRKKLCEKQDIICWDLWDPAWKTTSSRAHQVWGESLGTCSHGDRSSDRVNWYRSTRVSQTSIMFLTAALARDLCGFRWDLTSPWLCGGRRRQLARLTKKPFDNDLGDSALQRS